MFLVHRCVWYKTMDNFARERLLAGDGARLTRLYHVQKHCRYSVFGERNTVYAVLPTAAQQVQGTQNVGPFLK